jgi:hypothetical protein
MNRVRSLTVALVIGGVLSLGAGCGDNSSPKTNMMKSDNKMSGTMKEDGARENNMTGEKK